MLRQFLSLLFTNLKAGCRLVLLRPVTRIIATPSQLVALLLLDASLLAALDFSVADAPRRFNPDGVQTLATLYLGWLLAGWLMARLCRRRERALEAVVALAGAYPALMVLAWPLLWDDSLLRLVDGYNETVYTSLWMAFAVWQGLVLLRVVNYPSPAAGPIRTLTGAIGGMVVLLLPACVTTPHGLVETDYSLVAADDSPATSLALDAEKLLSGQFLLLDQALNGLATQTPGQIDLYLLSFGGYGDQDLFRNEALLAQRLFDRRFRTEGRSLALINHLDTLASHPLANGTNLSRSLDHLDSLIEPNEDVLVLYLTSHGAPEDHALSVVLGDVPLNDLTPGRLAELLDHSRFRYQVVLISACFSGGFVPALKSPNRLIMTSAAADRSSFGCSDDARLSYFGEALLANALNRSGALSEAYELAREWVEAKETEWEYESSRPQLHVGDAIRSHLNQPELALTVDP